MKPRALAIALIFPAVVHLFALVDETRAPAAPDASAGSLPSAPLSSAQPTAMAQGRLPTAAPDYVMPAFVATTPFVAIGVASLPRREAEAPPTPAATQTPLPLPERPGCDPAYPDERTCIPLGPPFDQGCAITAERRFTVVAPDPQGLDHDKDGVGCEPIR